MPRQRKTTTPTPAAGHNSVDRDRLRSLVDRIEDAENDKLAIAEDLRGLYAEARSAGFDATALRQVIRMRRQDAAERSARKELVQSYLEALGDFGNTALGAAAIARVSGGLMPPV
jgi:uncharacterized protein (UPF0335 family)